MQSAPETPASAPGIDFEEWARLAEQDPEAFEARRREVLAGVIEGAPEPMRRRLEGLQWRVDRIRETAGTPLAACVRINEMMWDSLVGPGGLLEAVQGLQEPGAPRAQRPGAQVLAFEPGRRRAAEG